MPRRICAADTVIYLDLPTLQCLRGVVGRYLFTEAVASRDKWDIFKQLAQWRCISGVVQNSRELLESDQLAERAFFVGTSVNGQTVRAPGATGKYPGADVYSGVVRHLWHRASGLSGR